MKSTGSALARGAVCLGVAVCLLYATPEAKAAITTKSIENHGAADGHRLSAKRQRQLIEALARITGDRHLRFDPDGRLLPGAGAAHGGSPTAHRILHQALQSRAFFIIEDHSDSDRVHFGQLDEGLNYENDLTRARFTIWRVRLDFADFDRMEAPPEVRAAFDIGFTFLHELLHGLGIKDTFVVGELGSCEQHVNRARAELGLVQRERYHGEPIELTPGLLSVRLRFRTAPAQHARQRTHYLFFTVRVGRRWTRSDVPLGDEWETIAP